MSIYCISFSPTGGTARVASLVARRLAAGDAVRFVELCDCTDDALPEFERHDLCVMAVPSYGGRVAAPAAERIAKLNGRGSLAVALCAFGNRAYEDTLVELQDLLEENDFRCIAGIAAIAEHSIVRSVAAKRPNARDAAELEGFADSIRARLAENPDRQLAPVFPGSRPYKPYGVIPMTPVADASCTSCGLCAKRCPVGAIPTEDPRRTDSKRCASCMRCIAVCPAHARHLDSQRLAALTAKLTALASEPKENELFL